MSQPSDLWIRACSGVSAASSAVFRIGFGVTGVLLVARFFTHSWIADLYLDPAYHFTYPGFEWVSPLPGVGMYVLFAAIGLSALAVAVGFRHRLFAVLFASGLTYVELIDRTLYLNHYYWLALTGFVIAFLPLNNEYSLDARLGRFESRGSVAAWVVWFLRFQVGMVYIFAGIAKLNTDWLLNAEPLATWLPARSDLWLVGPLLTLPATAFGLSWTGALFDLTIVLWLSLRRTRHIAYAAVVMFHLATWILFPSIGLFPLVMSFAALVFFPTDWPRRLRLETSIPAPSIRSRISPLSVSLVAVYVIVMLALPLRHQLSQGDVAWTGAGYLGSWHVMLTEKSGSVEFIVADPATDTRWRAGPPAYLTDRQTVVMATDPGLIAQTAVLISDEYGGLPVSADARLAINGRPSAQFTDPDVIIAGPGASPPDEWVLDRPPADTFAVG
jgi:vitamin K-dependent gamma-carboxylase